MLGNFCICILCGPTNCRIPFRGNSVHDWPSIIQLLYDQNHKFIIFLLFSWGKKKKFTVGLHVILQISQCLKFQENMKTMLTIKKNFNLALVLQLQTPIEKHQMMSISNYSSFNSSQCLLSHE